MIQREMFCTDAIPNQTLILRSSEVDPDRRTRLRDEITPCYNSVILAVLVPVPLAAGTGTTQFKYGGQLRYNVRCFVRIKISHPPTLNDYICIFR